jgi:hypothetical protein
MSRPLDRAPARCHDPTVSEQQSLETLGQSPLDAVAGRGSGKEHVIPIIPALSAGPRPLKKMVSRSIEGLRIGRSMCHGLHREADRRRQVFGDLAAPNIFRLSRRGDTALVLDSADDHEALHTYSLPSIVMYVRNALLSA